MKPIQGIHHITVMAGDPQKNVDFYTQILGQRFVKKTVNFDDPSTYHLYYGDNVGSPGTIMTFFPWPTARRGQRGVGETGAVAYAILPSSLDYWQARLAEFDISYSTYTRFGESVLTFPDPDGMLVELVATDGESAPTFWADGPIPEAHALRAFHSVTLWVSQPEQTAAVLTEVFGYVEIGQEGNRLRFKAEGAIAQYIDLLVRTDIGRGRMGAGSVHHVAFRTLDDSEQLEYQSKISAHGHDVTEVKDRQYFQSIYFREPNGVLFEVATDAPGFPYDEPVESLGSTLKLPSWLEPHRERIEQALPALEIPEYAN